MIPCHVNGVRIGGDAPVRLMGVLNVSPESFCPSSYVPPAGVREAAFRMIDEGADIVDIGGRATGPTSPSVSISAELERVCTALKELEGSGITVSIDTFHTEVLKKALRYDIHVVNDISGLSSEGMGALIKDAGLPAILMAADTLPGDAGDTEAVISSLGRVTERCARWGVREYVLDPGIGLWTPSRTIEDNWELCRRFSAFMRFGRPLLAAVSRKTFIGALVRRGVEGRVSGSLALALYLLQQGASMVRAHDVRETRDVISVYEALDRRAN
ncbi:MAG: dihydropteroate synthase [Methanomicrobiales archaeon]|nr:dihydropteroate synthase [Methanomicrobiales archaeon]